MIFTLQTKPRNTVKKSDLTQLRASGMIPIVVYGTDLPATKLSILASEFAKYYKRSFTELTFYELEVNGKKYNTMLKERQIHPVTRSFLHLDFMVVAADSTIEMDIPLNVIGEPIGVQEGGFMDVIQRTVKVIAKPTELPEDLELDVSDMNIGDTKHIRDLPQGVWSYKDAEDVPLVVIHGKAAEEAAIDEGEAEKAAESAESTEGDTASE